MARPHIALLAVALSVAAVGLTAATAASSTPGPSLGPYVAVDLGTLYGRRSFAFGISDAGQVVGYSDGSKPFSWRADTGMVELPTVPGRSAFAIDVNNAGSVVGWSQNLSYRTHATLWDPSGGRLDLGTIGGARRSSAHAINESGQVVGVSDTAFLWDPASGMTSLGTLGGPLSTATDINATGEVSGHSRLSASSFNYHAFLWRPGQGIVDLGTLGGSRSYAWGINDSGQVVGNAETSSRRRRAFLWDSGVGMTDLGTLGGAESGAEAINELGQVVGWSLTASGEVHAFLWKPDGGMIDLGTLGGASSVAYDINSAGQIVGRAWTPSGDYHATLWRPASPRERVATMTSAVQLLPLRSGERRSLVAVLDAIARSLDRGLVHAAQNQLLAFTRSLEAKVPARLSAAQAQPLIDEALSVWEALNES